MKNNQASIRGKDFDTSTNKVCFFPNISKKLARGFLMGGEPFVTDFVKYKTSETKQTYSYIKIFGGLRYFSKFTKCQLLIWSGAIFNQTQLKNWPGVSLRVANPLSLNFCFSVFIVKKYKTKHLGAGFSKLTKW